MQKKPLKNLGNYLDCCLIGLLCGTITFAIFAIPFDIFKLKINPQLIFQIDLVNILSLFTTIALTLYVLRVLKRKDDGDKVERDLLINYFNEFQNKFTEEIHLMSTIDGVEGAYVALILKKYEMYMQELLELAREYYPNDEINFKKLEIIISEIRELLSNIPRLGDVEDGIKVEGTKILYSTKHLREITYSMGKFRKSIFSIIVGINRY